MNHPHSLSEREYRDRIVCLAGQATWVRAVGGRVLRAEMVGEHSVLLVEEDPLFRGFNQLSGLGLDPDAIPDPIEIWKGTLPVSWLRRMAIAQTGVAMAGSIALSGSEMSCGWHPDPGYDIESWPGTPSAQVLRHFCEAMDADEETEDFLGDLIARRVRFTLFENWEAVSNTVFLIFGDTANQLIDTSDHTWIRHPLTITAELADSMWQEATRAMENCLK